MHTKRIKGWRVERAASRTDYCRAFTFIYGSRVPYLAAENQRQQQRNGQLGVTEEYNVEQVRIRWRLQKQPAQTQDGDGVLIWPLVRDCRRISEPNGCVFEFALTWTRSESRWAGIHCKWPSIWICFRWIRTELCAPLCRVGRPMPGIAPPLRVRTRFKNQGGNCSTSVHKHDIAGAQSACSRFGIIRIFFVRNFHSGTCSVFSVHLCWLLRRCSETDANAFDWTQASRARCSRWLLTRREEVIPPVVLAQERLQVVGGAPHHDHRRRHNRTHQQSNGHAAAQNAQSLQQRGVRNFDRFGRAHPEYHRNSAAMHGSAVGNEHMRVCVCILAR